MEHMPSKVRVSVIVATVTVALDWIFHKTLTNPMETFDYFTVKWLLAFFVATVFVNWYNDKTQSLMSKTRVLLIFAGVFSFLMSLYYRWWEYFSNLPFSSRAPDIIFLDRSNVILFAGTWFIGHALFFIVGVLVARKLIKGQDMKDE